MVGCCLFYRWGYCAIPVLYEKLDRPCYDHRGCCPDLSLLSFEVGRGSLALGCAFFARSHDGLYGWIGLLIRIGWSRGLSESRFLWSYLF